MSARNRRLGQGLGVLAAVWALCPLGLRAAEPNAPAASQPDTYWLSVTGADVNLRSRPDQNSTPVARLTRDTVLEAVSLDYGWHRVVPPAGAFSYVSAEYVDRRSPTLGVVSLTSGSLRVRVGSASVTVDPNNADVQTTLPLGTEVRIMGRDGAWLRIAPPAGVYMYVSETQTQRITADEAAELRPAVINAPPSAALPTTSGPAANVTSAPVSVDMSGPWGQRLTAVEQAITAQTARPALEQQWDDLLARLTPIARQAEEPAVARLATQRLARLAQRRDDQARLRAAQQIAAQDERDRAQRQRELENIEQSRRQADAAAGFAARGELRASAALPSTAQTKYFALHDPLDAHVIAYLEFSAAAATQLAPAGLVGQYIGVQGGRRRDAQLGADVIVVTSLQRVTPPTTSQPVTRPASSRPATPAPAASQPARGR